MFRPVRVVTKGLRDPSKISGHLLKETSVGDFVGKWFDFRSTNIYTEQWDLLIVLDSCRPDALREVADDYAFLPDQIPTIISVGGGSVSWMMETFTDDHLAEIKRTTYISANPHTRRILGSTLTGAAAEQGGPVDQLSQFADFLPIWEKQWDVDLGTVRSQPVTDRVINYCRTHDTKRLIAHYMQPHFPSVPDTQGEGMDINNNAYWKDETIWSRFRNDDISLNKVWEAYIKNLRYVLDDVAVVLRNVDAETVVITADHGEAFREHNCTGHGETFLTATRRVPWVKVAATDNQEYTPDTELSDDTDTISVDEKLKSLGYRM